MRQQQQWQQHAWQTRGVQGRAAVQVHT
jgi:hypothetical protein